MKTSKRFYILIAILFVLSSCKDIFVTTKLNNDGSFTRIVAITGDSSEIINSSLPYPIDNSWSREFAKDENDSSKYILTYSKHYENPDLLNAEIQDDTSKMKFFKRNIEIIKQSGFFYSYLTFRETYLAYNPFSNLDYTTYLSEEDIELLSGNTKTYSHADSLQLEKAQDRQDDFLLAAASEEIMAGLTGGVNRLNDSSLTKQVIHNYSDSIKAWINKENDILSDTAIFALLQEKTGIEAFSKLTELQPPVLLTYNESMEKLLNILEFESFTQIVEMPGLITETNSTELKGNQVRWEVEADSFLVKDNMMYVESRVVNYWAFVMAGSVILALVTILVLKGFRR